MHFDDMVSYTSRRGDSHMKNLATKAYQEERLFNFDIARMDAALKAPTHRMPKGLTREEFRAWMKSKKSSSARTQ